MRVSKLNGENLSWIPVAQEPPPTDIDVDWDTWEITEFDVSYLNEVPVVCAICRDWGRTPSTMLVLRTVVWPDGIDPMPGYSGIWGLPPGNDQVVVLSCANRSCRSKRRITRAELVDRYHHAVTRRVGTVWV